MPSAIEMEIIRAGDGKYYPKKGETVAVHYTMSLADGTEVDNTYKRRSPFRFKVESGQVVKGWDEAVKQLSVGEKASCMIPADFAYKDKGLSKLIPPGANLRVTMELIAIMKGE
jgi:FK506-binding protein 1|tara:strand:- start:181 stop:522 length:342 start_codon:yes stop_codon:yes gene_type:complete